MKAEKMYSSQFEKVKEITDKLEAGIKELMDITGFGSTIGDLK